MDNIPEEYFTGSSLSTNIINNKIEMIMVSRFINYIQSKVITGSS